MNLAAIIKRGKVQKVKFPSNIVSSVGWGLETRVTKAAKFSAFKLTLLHLYKRRKGALQ